MRLKVHLPALAFVIGLFSPSAARAHGVTWVEGGPATVVTFQYSTGEPMAFAEILVRAPGETNGFQKGRADRNGRFAFSPDHDGPWTVTVDDGMGHVVHAEVTISAGAADIAYPPADPFRTSLIPGAGWAERTILGLSLITNLACLGFVTLTRSRKK